MGTGADRRPGIDPGDEGHDHAFEPSDDPPSARGGDPAAGARRRVPSSSTASGGPATGAPTTGAAGTARATGPAAAAPDDSTDAWLAVGRKGVPDLEVILASGGEQMFDALPTGVPVQDDWGRLIVARPDGAQTKVENLVVQPGFGGEAKTIDGAWRLPTVGPEPVPGRRLGRRADDRARRGGSARQGWGQPVRNPRPGRHRAGPGRSRSRATSTSMRCRRTAGPCT